MNNTNNTPNTDNNTQPQNNGRFTTFMLHNGIEVLALAVCYSLAMQFVLSLITRANTQFFEQSVGFWIINLLYSLGFGVVALVYSRARKIDIPSAMRLNKRFCLTELLFMLVLIFVLLNAFVPLNNWFCQLIGYDPSINGSGISTEQVTDNIVLAVITVCIAPAISEELLFRGIIGNALSRGFSLVASSLICGALFAIFHYNPAQTLYQFVLGTVLMIFVLRNGSIWLGVLGHFFSNTCVIILALFVEPSGFYQHNAVWLVPVGIVLAVVAMALWLRFKRAPYNLPPHDKTTLRTMPVIMHIIAIITIVVMLILWIGVLSSGKV